MTLLNAAALAITILYGMLAVWAVIVTVHRRRRGDVGWPITAGIGIVSTVWAGWYGYLFITCMAPGQMGALLTRTLHIPTITLFAVSLLWRWRKP